MAAVVEAARAVALVPVPEAAEVCLAEAEELLSARDRITSALAARVGRVHRAGEAKNHGHASTKLWLRSAGGMTPAGAGRLLTMSMELVRLHEVRRLFAEGSLPEGIVEAICIATSGLTDDQATTAERILLELARSAGAAEVAKAGRFLRAVLDPDGHEKDEQADFDRRLFRIRRRRNGGVEGEFYLPVEAAARLQHWLDVYAKPKAEGDDRTPSVRNADALIALLENKIATELLVLVNAESLPDDPATAPGSGPRAGDAPGRDSGRCESDIPECDGDRFGSDAPMRGDEHWADAPVSRDPGVDAPTCGDERPATERSATGSPNVAEPHSDSAHGDEHAEPGGGRNCTGNRRASGYPDEDRPAGDCPADDCTAGDYRHAFTPGATPSGTPRTGADAWPGNDAWPGPEPSNTPDGEYDTPSWVGADAPPGLGGNSPPGVWLRGLPGLILATGHLLPVAGVHRLARTSTLVRVVINAAGQVLDMGRKVRLATPAQRRAVFARYATCWVDGCPLPATMCQIDHAEDWCSGGLTDLKLLGPACQFHNRDRYRHPTRYTRRKIGADRWAFTYRNPRTTRTARRART
ncbi:HNH endonuclease signature motif containing protein [Microbispora triticiradicis]|uniref:HNH endonuclease signature motif containing protein n=1 Tax=Microbispora TaxID=2005 RepID=UPI00142EF0F3|nr:MULTISPECIES: HNH endonuclease signature motif containing protein [Microbispora]